MDTYLFNKHRRKGLRWTVALLFSSLTIACTNAPSQPVLEKRSILEPVGENAGSVVIFSLAEKYNSLTLNSYKNNVVAIFINNHFLAVLPKNHVVSQGLCAGDYNLTVRSTDANLSPDQKVVRHISDMPILVEKGKTSYFELARQGETWGIKQIDEQQAKKHQRFFEEDKLFVRRLPASFMQCQQ